MPQNVCEISCTFYITKYFEYEMDKKDPVNRYIDLFHKQTLGITHNSVYAQMRSLVEIVYRRTYILGWTWSERIATKF